MSIFPFGLWTIVHGSESAQLLFVVLFSYSSLLLQYLSVIALRESAATCLRDIVNKGREREREREGGEVEEGDKLKEMVIKLLLLL